MVRRGRTGVCVTSGVGVRGGGGDGWFRIGRIGGGGGWIHEGKGGGTELCLGRNDLDGVAEDVGGFVGGGHVGVVWRCCCR